MTSSSRLCLDLALAVLLVLGTGAAACGRDAGDAGGPGDGEAAELPADGEGMEPRIVTEHPVDSPGRPADADRAAVAIDAEPGAAWVPHLTAADLEASVDFYRQLGFEVASRRGDERAELARDGVRLVLVAAPAGAGAVDRAEAGTEAGDDAAPAGAPAVVLHLVDEEAGGEGGRTVRDPDGHRVALPGGG
jgi:catechol 2,3-dioxygenase-like lactoylglutathione lyase family enzyme